MKMGRPVSRKKFVVVEGYDGSGKSTLIDRLQMRLPELSIRVVGRKKEPGLVDISTILERDHPRPDPKVEMLLRISTEMERLNIITKAVNEYDLVICDRGVVSMISWFDYLGVDRTPYEPLIQQLVGYHRDALTVVCEASFEVCWERSSNRSEKSRKDMLGKEVNHVYYDLYESNIALYAAGTPDTLLIDTAQSHIDQTTDIVLGALHSMVL